MSLTECSPSPSSNSNQAVRKYETLQLSQRWSEGVCDLFSDIFFLLKTGQEQYWIETPHTLSNGDLHAHLKPSPGSL